MSEQRAHVPVAPQDWGMPADSRAKWCKACGFLLVKSSGESTSRAGRSCNPAKVTLR
jgi:hypothetical protein